MGLPFHINTPSEYDQACARCEHWVVLSEADRDRLVPLLAYDKRRGGAEGRALRTAVPELGLLANDRLEATESLMDVGKLEEVSKFPIRICFWRRSSESMTKHRFPLFCDDVGISPASLALDLLHTFHLGVLTAFNKHAIWCLLEAKVWGDHETTRSEGLQIAVLCLRSELWRWYAERARTHPGENLTRVADFVPSMLGTPSAKQLRTKAAENWGLLLFVRDALVKFRAPVGADADRLAEAADCLIKYIGVLKANGAEMPPAALQDHMAAALRPALQACGPGDAWPTGAQPKTPTANGPGDNEAHKRRPSRNEK